MLPPTYRLHVTPHANCRVANSTNSGCCEFCCCRVTLSGFLISPHCNVFCKMGRTEPTPKGRLGMKQLHLLKVAGTLPVLLKCTRLQPPPLLLGMLFHWILRLSALLGHHCLAGCLPDPDSREGTMPVATAPAKGQVPDTAYPLSLQYSLSGSVLTCLLSRWAILWNGVFQANKTDKGNGRFSVPHGKWPALCGRQWDFRWCTFISNNTEVVGWNIILFPFLYQCPWFLSGRWLCSMLGSFYLFFFFLSFVLFLLYSKEAKHEAQRS